MQYQAKPERLGVPWLHHWLFIYSARRDISEQAYPTRLTLLRFASCRDYVGNYLSKERYYADAAAYRNAGMLCGSVIHGFRRYSSFGLSAGE